MVFAEKEPIFFKPEDREAAAKAFREPKAYSPTKYRWQNLNSGPGIYHYGVRVVDNGKGMPAARSGRHRRDVSRLRAKSIASA